ARRMQKTCIELCAVHRFDAHIEGAIPDGPSVMVSNHLSYVDAPVLASLTPSMPVAKAEIARWPLFGAGARSLGVMLVKRGDVYSGALALRGALRTLAAGVPVLGFPEGTTTAGVGELLAFRRGLFGIARIAHVPVVPMALSYNSPEIAWVGEEWFVPHYLR